MPVYPYVPGPPFDYYAGIPPVSPNVQATFWALGTGNPIVGPGADAGSYTVPAFPWLYFYAGYSNFAAQINSGWGLSSFIDGCIQDNGPLACTCVLITDHDGADSYFALVSNAGAPGTWDTILTQPGNDAAGNAGPIILRPIPAPTILNAARKTASFDLDLTVTVPMPAAGIYQSGGSCECGPVGYKVKQQIVLRGSPPPTTRDAGWTDMTLVGGGAQPLLGTAMGSPVALESLCGATDQDVYIAAELIFDSGFVAPVVSKNATRIECGPNIAEPERPRFRPGSQQPPRTPTRTR
jgi:hypothetical protein